MAGMAMGYSRMLLVFLASGMLPSCTQTRSPIWETEAADRYRVTSFESSACTGDTERNTAPAPYFMVKKVAGAKGSSVDGLRHHTFYWCATPAECEARGYGWTVMEYDRTAPQGEQVRATANAFCEIRRQTVTDGAIKLRTTLYSADAFTQRDCETLPERWNPKFECVSDATVTGTLVPIK